MSDADYQFFSYGEYIKATPAIHNTRDNYNALMNLLRDKCQWEHFSPEEGRFPGEKIGRMTKHTHEIIYFTREIKPEVVDDSWNGYSCNPNIPETIALGSDAKPAEEESLQKQIDDLRAALEEKEPKKGYVIGEDMGRVSTGTYVMPLGKPAGVKPEVVDCKCELKRTKMTRNPQTDGSVILAHCEVDNKYCPKCGERLKADE